MTSWPTPNRGGRGTSLGQNVIGPKCLKAPRNSAVDCPWMLRRALIVSVLIAGCRPQLDVAPVVSDERERIYDLPVATLTFRDGDEVVSVRSRDSSSTPRAVRASVDSLSDVLRLRLYAG